MKAKTFSLFALSMFALVLVAGFASAAEFHPSELDGSVQQGQAASLTFTIENTHSSDLTAIYMTKTDLVSGSNTISSSNLQVQSLPSTISDGQNSSEVTLQVMVPSDQAVGVYTGQLELFGTLSSNGSRGALNVTLTVTEAPSTIPEEIQACSTIGTSNVNGDNLLEIRKINFDNNGIYPGSTFGKDDEWFPFENVDVEIEVKNPSSYDLDNVEISWGLWDTQNNEWVIDFDDEKDFKLKDGDKETLTLSFTLDDNLDVDLEDLDDGDHYKFYVTARAEVDDNDASYDGAELCVSDDKQVSIIIENDFVVLTNFEIPDAVQCGQTVTATADVWNIGDSDQDDVSVEVYGRENALNVGKVIKLGDMDSFDSQKISVTFQVPQGLSEGFYALKFQAVDEDGNVYEDDFDDDLSEFTVPFEVKGGCVYATPGTTEVTAELTSDAKAGRELVVRATVKNTGDKTVTYDVELDDYTDWATLVDYDPSTFTVDAGESQDVTITLKIDNDAEGEHGFNMNVYSKGVLIKEQPFENIDVQPSGLAAITGNVITADNWHLWAIGAFNVILLVVIIIVAVRVVRRKD